MDMKEFQSAVNQATAGLNDKEIGFVLIAINPGEGMAIDYNVSNDAVPRLLTEAIMQLAIRWQEEKDKDTATKQ